MKKNTPNIKKTESIGDRLRMARDEKHWTQKMLSDVTGISQPRIVQFEKGSAIPPSDRLELLANALDVSEDWLYFGRTEEQVDNIAANEGSTVGRRIKTALEEASIDINKLSILTGIDTDLLKSYMNDEKSIILVHVEIIATTLSVRKSWLAFGGR